MAGRVPPPALPRRARNPQTNRPAGPAAAAAASGGAPGRQPFSQQPAVRHGAQLARGNPAHIVMAEFLVALGIILMRTIGQYEPRAGGAARGVIKPGKPGALGPLPMIASTLLFYFLLAVLAVSGGARARVAAVAGLIYDLAMLLNSTDELNKLSLHLADIGKGKRSPGGGPGPGSSAYQSALSGPGGTQQPGSGYPLPPGKDGKCPPGYTYDSQVQLCIADILPGTTPF